MTDYETDVRSVETEYTPTLPRQAGREVDSGHELHLASVTVQVRVVWRSNSERYSSTFDVSYRVNHGDEIVIASSIDRPHESETRLSLGKTAAAVKQADSAVLTLLRDVGVEYTLHRASERFDGRGEAVMTHTTLDVVETEGGGN